MPSPVICWFRQDLRLSDNPAWFAACSSGSPVIPIYILDDQNAKEWKIGEASCVWLHHSLEQLSQNMNGNLLCMTGKADRIIPDLIQRYGVKKIFWNRCYEPWRVNHDKIIKENLLTKNILIEDFNGSLLWEPWEIKKQDGTPYKVFTPYFRKGCLNAPPPREPLRQPKLPTFYPTSEQINKPNDLNLLPKTPRWDTPMMSFWTTGESAAQTALDTFLDKKLSGYKEGRNFPEHDQTSKLSPHLHFGEISPNQIWYKATEHGIKSGHNSDLDCFQSELAWREFSHSLLFYNPHLPTSPLNRKFENFNWADPDQQTLEKWQTGQTGYPIVDAGMRELWATGYMHNRVRMIVASFLIKDLRYHWRIGEDWFWNTLVDANLANNAASWQWVAGCGADAAPYFRIFNPTTQSEKFDPLKNYIRKWAPDSHTLPPIVDHKKAREAALEAFKAIK
ncbi:MAG: deoxyribodipyrimidine photo-lyase [Alphaproteobacteria bacterium]|nr:deoxyribodipyrimidine photo-lyase [Alphaproteobacteria bacterium]MCB9984827.1 deoxyribodipyrimidine photo-lyase [Micavibrio sp.]HPQ51064.1 deoxyribodipyrimidine photo-lyase [Alphaproteobacteria bacterium]